MNRAAPARPDSADHDAEAAISAAEAAVAALADQFLGLIADELETAKAALERARANPGDNNPNLQVIFGVMHNLKGQGSSFGYDLLTMIGGSLCGFIRDAEGPADEKQIKVIAAHFAAIDFVVEKDIRGTAGEIGAPLMAKLETLIANVPAIA